MSSELVAVLENGIVTVAPNSEFTNEKLQRITSRIFDLTVETKRNMFEIAVLLAQVKNEELYKSAGYKSIHEYAEKNFGYKRSMMYKMLDVADKFIEGVTGGFKSKLAHEQSDYTVSQLMEISSVEFDAAHSLDATGTISPEMTTKEIREIVKDYKNGEIDAQGLPIKPVEENEENGGEIDATENGGASATDIDIASEFNAIIEHCNNLLNCAEISGNTSMKKKIDAFMKFAMKSVVNYTATKENQEGINE